MLFWNVVLDGDGVGEGVVAWDAGATISRSGDHGGEKRPHNFQQSAAPSLRQASRCASQNENLHMGVVWVAPLQPLRTVMGTGWSGYCDALELPRACDLRHPVGLCYSPGGAMNAAREQGKRRDR